jgi:hypothetical protein
LSVPELEESDTMFEDDPEMQEMIAAYQAMPEPQEKPEWWFAVQAGLLAAGAGGAAALAYGLGLHVWPALVCGCLAGIACSLAVLGFRSGWFRYRSGPWEGEKVLLWMPLRPVHRVLCGLAVPLLLVFGLYASHDETQRANRQRAPGRAAAPLTKPRGR